MSTIVDGKNIDGGHGGRAPPAQAEQFEKFWKAAQQPTFAYILPDEAAAKEEFMRIFMDAAKTQEPIDMIDEKLFTVLTHSFRALSDGKDVTPLLPALKMALALNGLCLKGQAQPQPMPVAAAQPKVVLQAPVAVLQPAAPGRTYFDVPFAEKDLAKKNGAHWDSFRKAWFAPNDASAEKLLNLFPLKD